MTPPQFAIGDPVWFCDWPWGPTEAHVVEVHDLSADWDDDPNDPHEPIWRYTLDVPDYFNKEKPLKTNAGHLFARPAGRNLLIESLRDMADSVNFTADLFEKGTQ